MFGLKSTTLGVIAGTLLTVGSAFGQLVTTNAETLVNVTTTDAQQEPAVAMDTSGRYVVVWESEGQDGDGYGIYAQIYNADHSVRVSEFQVNMQTAIDQRFPDVAITADGSTIMVVWQSNHTDTEGWDIRQRFFDIDGTFLAGEGGVNSSGTAGNQMHPAIASSDGMFAVTYMSDSTGNYESEIHGRYYDNTGAALTSPFIIDAVSGNHLSHPAVAMDTAGNTVFVWQDHGAIGDVTNIRGVLYDNTGTATTSVFYFTNGSTNNKIYPSIARAKNGEMIIVYSVYNSDGDHYGVYGRKFTNTGSVVGGQFLVNSSTTGSQDHAKIAVSRSGERYVVTWTDDSNEGDKQGVYARAFSWNLTDYFSNEIVNTSTADRQLFSDVALRTDSTDAVFVWQGGLRKAITTGLDTDQYGVYTLAAAVADTDPPSAVCQNITVYLDATGNVTITASDVDGGSSDNFGIDSLHVSQTAFTCADIGNNVVVLTVYDEAGNSDACSAAVTVVDSVTPTAVCQNATVYLDGAGTATVLAGDIDNGSTDNCTIAAYALSQTNFSCADVGANTVTLSVTDDSGNTGTCAATITVIDSVTPTASCQDITVYLDGTGSATVTGADLDAGSTDNCAGLAYAVSQSTFNCADIGVVPVTLTVTDASGNSASCASNVTIIDSTAPVVSCQDITVYLDGSGNATITTGDVDNGSSDNCSIASLILSQTAFTCANVGANTVTLTATDASGNSASCSSTVTVVDSTAPAVSCQDITVYLDGTGSATITTGDVDAGSSDICGAPSLSLSQTTFTCANTGVNTVTLTATDASGNSASCTSTVTVVDSTAPTALCQDITVYLDGTGNATITGADLDAGSTDNCSVASLTASSTSFTCANIGANTVTLTATDASGNTATCTSVVTVVDSTAPTASCQDITVYLDGSGNATITTGDVDNGSSDNCSIASLALSQTAFTCANVGANTVTLTATDASGNSTSCTSTVTVVDSTAPTASCQDITVYLDGSGSATITAGDLDNGSSDNCGVPTLTASQTTFTCANAGVNTVTLTATDASGNSASCTSTVTVVDSTAPTALCQDITVYLDGTGNATITGADLDAGSTDNCSVASLTASSTSFTCANIGANTVTLTATDASGNTATCTSVVTVVDSTAPTASCQDITVYLDASGNASVTGVDLDGGSTDNCGIVTYTAGSNAFTCADIGTGSVTLTVTDASGNSSSCVSNVTVMDTMAPTVSCQDITVYLDGTGNATITSGDIDAGSTDNCGIASLVVSTSSFNCSNVGANTVTLTATDINGNTASCTATVTVLDSIAPTAVCQDITVYLDGSGNATITAADIDGGSTDECGAPSLTASQTTFSCGDAGANTVTLTATDASGNTSTCAAMVTVVDSTAPTVVCQDVTLYLDASGNASISGVDLDGGSTDNCGIVSYVAGSNAFTCADIGTGSVTLTVTDASGNSSSCVANVTVMDTLAPTVTCQDTTIYLDASGNASITIGAVLAGATDNCGVASSTVSTTDFDCSTLGANTVSVVVTDVNGNADSCLAVVTVMDSIAPTLTGCPSDTTFLANSAGCTGVYTWTAPTANDNCNVTLTSTHNSGDAFPVGATTVTYTATDDAGNVVTCSFVVTVTSDINVTAVGTDVSCNGGNDGTATATVTGGYQPYDYAWSSGGTSDVEMNLTAGTHTVIVTDSVGCSDTTDVTVIEPSALNLTATTQDELNGNDGSIDLTVSGGVGPYDYDWSNGETTEDISGLVGNTTYTVVVTDANGCVDSLEVYVDSKVGVDEVSMEVDLELELFPNPTNDGNFSVAFIGAWTGEIEVEVFDARSRIVYQAKTLEEVLQVSMEFVEQGSYYLRATDAAGASLTRQIVKIEH